MSRLGAVFWLLLVLATALTTFKVKYAVQEIEDELNKMRKHTVAEQQEIRVLTAEWTYLTQPERLADLNRRFLSLAPVGPKQLQRGIADIALRPVPAAPAAPDVLVASNPDPAAPKPAVSAAPAVAPVTPVAAAAANPAPAVRFAKAGDPSIAGSIDDLIAQIAETR